MTRTVRHRLLGVVFIATLVALVGLSVGRYAGAFERPVPVTLQVSRVGTQLEDRADVKLRGIEVGTVASVATTGTGATVQLAIDPDKIEMIPGNVSAQLIPKTLFGERYVSLVTPDGITGAPLEAGAVIPMDRSESARELERVLDNLLPLLTAVKPEDLATTLGAMSQALEGRGDNLGETLVQMQELTSGLNPSVPTLQKDITELADFARNADKAAPDLLDALADLTTTSKTIVEQRADLRATLVGVAGASDDLRKFLDANGENIIALSASSRPTLESVARYSPEFPCVLEQLTGLVPRIDEAFGKGSDRNALKLTIEITAPPDKYVPHEDEPAYLDDRGPHCYPIVYPGPEQPPEGEYQDGVDSSGSSADGPALPGLGSAGSGIIPSSYQGMGLPNSPAEQQMIRELVAVQDGSSPNAVPAWSSMLVGPLYRGTEVTLT